MKLYAEDVRSGRILKDKETDPFHGLAQFYTSPWLHKEALNQVWTHSLTIILFTIFIRMLYRKTKRKCK